MEKDRYHIIIENSDGEKLDLTIHWDAGIEEWLRLFRVILYWISFDGDTIKEYLPDD